MNDEASGPGRTIVRAFLALCVAALLFAIWYPSYAQRIRLDDVEYLGAYGTRPAPWFLDTVPFVVDTAFRNETEWPTMTVEPRLARIQRWPWQAEKGFTLASGYWLTAQHGEQLRVPGYKTAMLNARGDTVYFEVMRRGRSYWDIAAKLDTLPPDTVRLFFVPGGASDGSLY